jgi:hypothetical protein
MERLSMGSTASLIQSIETLKQEELLVTVDRVKSNVGRSKHSHRALFSIARGYEHPESAGQAHEAKRVCQELTRANNRRSEVTRCRRKQTNGCGGL